MATPGQYEVCALCERSLLRGEQPEVFLNDGERRDVCELCVPQALYAGWIRVGVGDAPTLEPNRGRRGTRALVERLKALRAGRNAVPRAPRTRRDTTAEAAPARERTTSGTTEGRSEWRPHRVEDEVEALRLAEKPAAPLAAYRTTATGAPAHVTTSGARMVARTIDLYNHSPHPRMLSGIARSLGDPWVTVRGLEGSRMQVIVAWELTWYRFEVDLARESAGVHAAGHGTSLSELSAADVEPNAIADAHGYLYLRSDATVA